MLDWLMEIDKPQCGHHHPDGNLTIRRIEPPAAPKHMSEICQLFVAYSVIIGGDALTQLPTPTDAAKTMIMNEIALHYSDVKEIYIDGILCYINVLGLKAESRRLIQDLLIEGIYPVIPDLYRSDDSNLPTGRRELKHFSVRLEAVHPLNTSETEKVGHFFQNTFFAESGSVFLSPTGWILEEALLHSLTLRTFRAFAGKLVLVVDTKDNRVIGLDVYG